jgi:hypothetical protein
MELFILLVVFPLVVVLVVLWIGRRRTSNVDDSRVLRLVASDAERTRAGFSCAQLPTERRRSSSVRGRD